MKAKPDTLWHCTRLNNIDCIIKEGLIAQGPEQREDKIEGVYLSTYRFNWMWNTTRQGKFKGATILVNVKGLELLPDYHNNPIDTKFNSKRLGRDYIHRQDIHPDRILEIWVETEKDTFQKLVGWKIRNNKIQE